MCILSIFHVLALKIQYHNIPGIYYSNYHGSYVMYVHHLNNVCSLSISCALAVNNNLHGIFSPPCGKSAEYLHGPVTTQLMVPPLLKNNEQTRETFQGKCPITVPSFVTATAYLSISFVGSRLQVRFSPMAASQTS